MRANFALLTDPCPREALRNNSEASTNHYLPVFSPSGFEEFVMATAILVPDNAVAPTKRQLQNDDASSSVQNVHKLATEFGILFA